MTMGKSDIELCQLVQEGEVWAFEQLVRKYQARLVSFARRYVSDPSTAEEIVQDAFVKTYLAMERISSDKKFSSYLFEVAKNTAISYLRKKRREVPIDDDVPGGETESRLEGIARGEEEQLARECVGQLPEKYRQVIKCYYFNELSYAETAKELGLPVNTVRTNLKRGKEKLKKLLTAHRLNR